MLLWKMAFLATSFFSIPTIINKCEHFSSIWSIKLSQTFCQFHSYYFNRRRQTQYMITNSSTFNWLKEKKLKIWRMKCSLIICTNLIPIHLRMHHAKFRWNDTYFFVLDFFITLMFVWLEKTTVLFICIHKWVKSIVFAMFIKSSMSWV